MSFQFLFDPVEELDAFLSGLFADAPLLVALGIALLLGIPLIVFKTALPAGLEAWSEKAIGLVILVLAGRVVVKWVRGDYGARAHAHGSGAPDGHGHRRHLRRADGSDHAHVHLRSGQQAASIGLIHGFAGTGAVVVLLIAALPSRLEAALALVVFAPMSIVSMAGCTAIFAWVLTRPVIEPIYRGILIPALGVFGMGFGLWYTGMG